jgi:hypothetical protein
MIIKMEVCECRKNVRETGDGRVTDRPMLLYGQFVSRRSGTSRPHKRKICRLCSFWLETSQSIESPSYIVSREVKLSTITLRVSPIPWAPNDTLPFWRGGRILTYHHVSGSSTTTSNKVATSVSKQRGMMVMTKWACMMCQAVMDVVDDVLAYYSSRNTITAGAFAIIISLTYIQYQQVFFFFFCLPLLWEFFRGIHSSPSYKIIL